MYLLMYCLMHHVMYCLMDHFMYVLPYVVLYLLCLMSRVILGFVIVSFNCIL